MEPAPSPSAAPLPADRPLLRRWQQEQGGQPGAMDRRPGGPLLGGGGANRFNRPNAGVRPDGQPRPWATALQALTPEEQHRMLLARQAAMRDRVVTGAIREAMIRADPNVAPVIEKFEKSLREARGVQQGRLQRRLDFLTEEERQVLVHARQAVQNDPAVASARQQVETAPTPEARRQAERAREEAVKAAMIRTDARVGAVLEKIRNAPPAAPMPPASAGR